MKAIENFFIAVLAVGGLIAMFVIQTAMWLLPIYLAFKLFQYFGVLWPTPPFTSPPTEVYYP